MKSKIFIRQVINTVFLQIDKPSNSHHLQIAAAQSEDLSKINATLEQHPWLIYAALNAHACE